MSQNTRFILTLLVLFVLAPVAQAQEAPSQGGSNSPGSPSQTVGGPGSAAPSPNPPEQPDTNPLTGAYLYTLGSLAEGRNYILPAFTVGEVGATNAGIVPNGTQALTTATTAMGEVALLHRSRTNELGFNYLGGVDIYNSHTSLDSSFHEVSLRDSVNFRRWTLTLDDLFSYLPEASFGFGGVSSFGGLGTGFFGGLGFGSGFGGLGPVNPALVPNQSILTSQYGAYNNMTLAQAAYHASARTSVSFVGSYGFLQAGTHQSGYLSGNDALGLLGVEHTLTARDTVGVQYAYSTFHYAGLPDSFNSQTVEGEYGRKITGRLGLQIYGGPELLNYRTPLGSTTGTYLSGMGALTYAAGRNNYDFYVGRYATGGSGVLAGAETTLVNGSWTRQVTRKWIASLYGGYSHNTSLSRLAGVASTHYGYWYGNLVLHRVLSHYATMYVGYEYQRQTTNSGPCTTAVCAGRVARQIFGVGITFTPRPIGL